METSIDDAVMGLDVNHGYIAVLESDNALDAHLVAERCVFGSTSTPITLLTSLLGIYYTHLTLNTLGLYILHVFFYSMSFLIL